MQSCLAVLWTIVSFTAYDDTHLPYIVTCGVDVLFLIPFIVIAAVLGQPLSYTTCSVLPKAGDGAPASNTSALLGLGTTDTGAQMSYGFFAGAEQTLCYELNAVWGLTIALSVLFAISAVATGFLFLGQRRAAGASAADSDSQVEIAMPPAMSYKEFDGASLAGSGYIPPPPPPAMSRPHSPASSGSFRGDQLHFRPE